jgi:hypothetical protein
MAAVRSLFTLNLWMDLIPATSKEHNRRLPRLPIQSEM